ncbi:Rieske 2Fe-2S domain-containing protein [Pseudonocardia sp. T1-2H]|uniref:Rieske 2Fe-2S domain-containing protein n=1 Tax=Pseudonocardia sp. T1-2H TaxID=3128899 RepID=UPI0031017F3A
MTWQVLCSAHEVVADEIKECTLPDGGRAIAVRFASGEVKVFQGTCPHQKRALADGDLYGDVLTCSAHMWEFDLQTGDGLNGTPAGLAEYPTKIEGDDVLVDASLVEPVALWR